MDGVVELACTADRLRLLGNMSKHDSPPKSPWGKFPVHSGPRPPEPQKMVSRGPPTSKVSVTHRAAFHSSNPVVPLYIDTPQLQIAPWIYVALLNATGGRDSMTQCTMSANVRTSPLVLIRPSR